MTVRTYRQYNCTTVITYLIGRNISANMIEDATAHYFDIIQSPIIANVLRVILFELSRYQFLYLDSRRSTICVEECIYKNIL